MHAMDQESNEISSNDSTLSGLKLSFDGKEMPIVNSNEFYCLDGGFASHLPTHYKQTVENDPLWSCRALHTNPEAVIQTHKDFALAGADIITTNTYQATAEHLRKHVGLDMIDPIIEPHALLEESVKFARRGAQEAGKMGAKPFIAGAVGPYGACLCDGSEYTGNYLKAGSSAALKIGKDDNEIRDFLRNWHRDRIKRLHLGGVDIHAVETIPGSLEALAILDVLEEFPGSKAWISFQCKEGGKFTAGGESIEDAFCALVRHRSFRFKIIAVGANCVNPLDVCDILKCFNHVNNWSSWPNILNYNKIPYIVYPNAGRSWDGNSKSWISEESKSTYHANEILDNIGTWMKLGANIIGGCCQIGPEITKLIKRKITMEMFAAIQCRQVEDEKPENINPENEWSSVLKRLEKPSESSRKKRKEAEENTER